MSKGVRHIEKSFISNGEEFLGTELIEQFLTSWGVPLTHCVV